MLITTLKVKINLSSSDDTYGSDFYLYQGIKAAKIAKLDSNVKQLLIQNDDDKYVFNMTDINALSFTKKDILNNAKQHEPADADDAKDQGSLTDQVEEDYLEDNLFPKAVQHTSNDD